MAGVGAAAARWSRRPGGAADALLREAIKRYAELGMAEHAELAEAMLSP